MMEKASLLVSKAGGLTCAEALIKHTPLVVFRPTPGQEVSNARYLESGGAAVHADSLDTVELVMALEEEFGIEVPDEQAEKLQSVGDVIKYIEDVQK